jgi:hypothetical protein
VLSGASVVGMECSATAIAAGLDEQIAWVDEQCEVLVRRRSLERNVRPHGNGESTTSLTQVRDR